MDKLFFYGGAAGAIFAALVLLWQGPAEGAETPHQAQDSRTPYSVDRGQGTDFVVHEFTPKSAEAMQCVFVESRQSGSTFCWPKIMNDQFQTLIDRLKEDRR